MAHTVPGGLEKDELRSNKGRFSNGCKDTTAALMPARLPVTWPQPAFPHQDKGHDAIQPRQLPHTLGSRTSQHATEMCVGLRTHFLIHLPWVRVWVLFSIQALSLYLSGSKIHCAVHQKEKGSPRKDQQEQQPWKPLGVEGHYQRAALPPKIHT